MGTCCSTTASSGHSSRRPRSDGGESRAPPPTIEEETVKEVLSETPRLIKPSKVRKSVPIISDAEEDEQEEEKGKFHEEDSEERTTGTTTPSPKPVFPIFKLDGEKIEKKVSELKNSSAAIVAEEISEVSEICSLSESVSTTTNVTRDDDEEFGEAARVYRSPMRLHHPKNRSLSGELGGGARREQRLAARKSPSRRSDQSPGRRNGNSVGSVRMVQARDPGRMMIRRGVTAAENQLRDTGEGSARRSRSPATTRAHGGGARPGVGRSRSARRVVTSPGRVNGSPVEANRRAAEDEKWQARNCADESLENPLVSLECFIFL